MRTIRIGMILSAAFLLVLTGTAPAALMLDINGNDVDGAGATMTGWSGFAAPSKKHNGPLTTTIPDPFGTGSDVTVTFTNDDVSNDGARWVDNGSFTGTGDGMVDLLRDNGGPRQDADYGGPDTMTIDLVLDAGTYTYTSYHHRWDKTDQLEDLLPFADISVNGFVEATNVKASNKASDAVSTFETTFTVDNDGDTVSIAYKAVDSVDSYFPINGFSLVPEPATMVVLGIGGLVALARRRR